MSSTNNSLRRNRTVTVMVRAFGDEPVRLEALGEGKKYVEVTGRTKSVSIGYPRSHVFQYDPKLFEQLKELFESGDLDAVRGLWARARSVTQATLS